MSTRRQRRRARPSSSSSSRSSPSSASSPSRWRRAEPGPPRRVGPGRPQLRRLGHLVPPRRRPLHRVHVRRRARRCVYGAGALGFFAVPYTIVVYPLVFLAAPRLWSVAHRHGYVTPADFVRGRHGSRDARAGHRDHRHRRDHALHRAPARRHRGGAEGDGRQRRVADHHRLRHPRRLHVPVRPARPGADRVRQGRADLHRRDRRRDLHPDQARRLRRHLRGRRQEVRGHARARRTGRCWPTRRRSATPRWRSARRWRCSSIRTRSPACWPRAAATRSSATWPRCPRTRSCSA